MTCFAATTAKKTETFKISKRAAAATTDVLFSVTFISRKDIKVSKRMSQDIFAALPYLTFSDGVNFSILENQMVTAELQAELRLDETHYKI